MLRLHCWLACVCLITACGSTTGFPAFLPADAVTPSDATPAAIDAVDVTAPDAPPDMLAQDIADAEDGLDATDALVIPDVAQPTDLMDSQEVAEEVSAPDADVAAPVDLAQDVTVGCSANSDCAPFEDGDLCNGTLICLASKCEIDAKTVVSCTAVSPQPCMASVCAKTTGLCQPAPQADGTACDDENACTAQDDCQAGACSGKAIDCDDKDPCSQDTCSAGVCAHAPQAGGTCDDGNKCTSGETCTASGTCVGSAIVCGPSKGACWTKACDAASGACVDAPLTGAGCDDSDKCTTGDTCASGTCGGTAVVCPNSNPCVAATCDSASGQCGAMNKPNGTTCQSDDDACTSQICTAGTCVVTTTTTNCMPDGDPCTDDTCHAATGCYAKTPEGGSCDDGNKCTQTDVCTAGKCAGAIDTLTCPAAKLETCPPKYVIQVQSQLLTGKLTLAVAAPLLPGGPTRVSHGLKMPAAGGAVPTQNVQLELSVTVTPPPSLPPVVAVVVGEANGTDCGTVVPSLLLPAKSGGTYEWSTQGGKTYWIALDLDPATYAKDATFVAYYTVRTADANGFCNPPADCAKTACEGKACSDGNLCTIADVCAAGACKSGAEKTCSADTNTCTTDLCNKLTGNCGIPLADGTTCDDGNPCTESDACKGILCKGSAKVCLDDNNVCTLDFCDSSTGACNYAAPDAAYCSDGNACTSGDACLAGVCKPGVETTCQNDSNPCTLDTCDPVSGTCGKALENGTACEEGNACTIGDTCTFGYCQAGPAVVCKNDFNACTVDTCDYKTGKCNVAVADGIWCDDGNACTDADKCKTGKCLGGTELICDDATCTADLCLPAQGCLHLAAIQQETPLVDGSLSSDWVGILPGTTNETYTDWGVGKNELFAVYLAQDATWLYVAVDGYVEPGNAIVGYVDTDYGLATGVADFKNLTDQSGALDNALSNTMNIESYDFGAELAFGTVGMQSCTGLADGAGWRRLSTPDDLAWIDADLQATAKGFETRIALASLYPNGMPKLGSSLAVVLRIVNADGSSLSNQVLPSQWFSDGTPGVPNPLTFAMLSDGACDDGNACTDGDTCSFGNCEGQPFTCAATGNPCTVAQCTPATGCAPAPLTDGTDCNNDTGCTSLDKCMSGICAEGTCP